MKNPDHPPKIEEILPGNQDNDSDWDDQVRLAARGDGLALERLLLGHFDLLRTHLLANLESREPGNECEDLIQQTWTQVFRGIGSLEIQTRAGFIQWLRTIAENQVRDARRKAGRQKRGGDRNRVELADSSRELAVWQLLLVDESTASKKLSQEEARQSLALAVGSLPLDLQRAVREYYLDGRSLAEIGAGMGRTPDAIRGLLERGRAKLREALWHL